MPNTLRALTNRMICTEIMSRLPDLRALHRVIWVNSFFYDEAETRSFLEAYLLPVADGCQQRPPPALASFAPDEQSTLLEVVKYDKQVRYLANKYIHTAPPQPWWQEAMTQERLARAFVPFRIMYTMFHILHTHDDPSSSSTTEGYQGNRRNKLLLDRAIPERDFADMATIESWLKRECRSGTSLPNPDYLNRLISILTPSLLTPVLEHFSLVAWPFDACPQHHPRPVMDRRCPAYDEFVLTAGLGHRLRLLRGQGFRYAAHLRWVQAHARHGAAYTLCRYVLLDIGFWPIGPLLEHSQYAGLQDRRDVAGGRTNVAIGTNRTRLQIYLLAMNQQANRIIMISASAGTYCALTFFSDSHACGLLMPAAGYQKGLLGELRASISTYRAQESAHTGA